MKLFSEKSQLLGLNSMPSLAGSSMFMQRSLRYEQSSSRERALKREGLRRRGDSYFMRRLSSSWILAICSCSLYECSRPLFYLIACCWSRMMGVMELRNSSDLSMDAIELARLSLSDCLFLGSPCLELRGSRQWSRKVLTRGSLQGVMLCLVFIHYTRQRQAQSVLLQMSSKANFKVYMDVQIGASAAGRVVFELFNDLTPRTAQNFRALCTGEYGKANNVRLHYLATKFHRIIDGFVIQGGDISNSGGKGGYSIYGRTFVDESFARTHSCAGLLSMANCGRNTNSSQFFITLKACPHLDGKHVVFGQVIDGMEIVKKISKVPIDKEDKPRYPVIVIDCGAIDDFRGFLRFDPFKREVFDQIREARERIIQDQHHIRKLLSEGLDPNDAYEYKKRLQTCDKNLAELDEREEELQRKKREENEQEENPEPEVTEKVRERLGEQRVNRLLDLKMKINQAQVANNKAALEEQIRENDVNYHKMMKKREWVKKQKEAEEEVQAKGLNREKLYLNRNALKKEEEEKPNTNFGWNVYGQEAFYKAYDKRCATLSKDEQAYKQSMQGKPVRPSEDALNKLQQDVIKQQQKRSTFSRRRVYDEGETVSYINERNRIYNRKLERNFGTYASSTKTALQMNNLK